MSGERWISGVGGRRGAHPQLELPESSAVALGRYHDPILHARNEAAFINPGRETFARLRDRGVAGLVADATAEDPSSPRLPDQPRSPSGPGDIAVYRLP